VIKSLLSKFNLRFCLFEDHSVEIHLEMQQKRERVEKLATRDRHSTQLASREHNSALGQLRNGQRSNFFKSTYPPSYRLFTLMSNL
jgi:hypothetical protein